MNTKQRFNKWENDERKKLGDITFLDKYNPSQFEIIDGISQSSICFNVNRNVRSIHLPYNSTYQNTNIQQLIV